MVAVDAEKLAAAIRRAARFEELLLVRLDDGATLDRWKLDDDVTVLTLHRPQRSAVPSAGRYL